MNQYTKRAPAQIQANQRPPRGARAIRLTRGWVAWVDADVFEELNSVLWSVATGFNGGIAYAVRGTYTHGKRTTTYMHRVVLPAAQIDHREHRPESKVVDNRRRNLRAADHSRNNQNRRKQRRPVSSRFKGVHLEGRKWRAQIRHNGPKRNLGSFDDEAAAARAYDAEARRLFGEFALTNFQAVEADGGANA